MGNASSPSNLDAVAATTATTEATAASIMSVICVQCKASLQAPDGFLSLHACLDDSGHRELDCSSLWGPCQVLLNGACYRLADREQDGYLCPDCFRGPRLDEGLAETGAEHFGHLEEQSNTAEAEMLRYQLVEEEALKQQQQRMAEEMEEHERMVRHEEELRRREEQLQRARWEEEEQARRHLQEAGGGDFGAIGAGFADHHSHHHYLDEHDNHN